MAPRVPRLTVEVGDHSIAVVAELEGEPERRRDTPFVVPFAGAGALAAELERAAQQLRELS